MSNVMNFDDDDKRVREDSFAFVDLDEFEKNEEP